MSQDLKNKKTLKHKVKTWLKGATKDAPEPVKKAILPNKIDRPKVLRLTEFYDEMNESIDKGVMIDSLNLFLKLLPRLVYTGSNRQDKFNSVMFGSRLIQKMGGTKHGTIKLLGKAKSVSEAIETYGLDEKKLFLDFGAGAHDPVALSTYFYLNGFDSALANDIRPPLNERYSAVSMFDILADVALFEEDFIREGTDVNDFRQKLRNFDARAFSKGDFYGGLAGTKGDVRFADGDIMDVDLEDNSVSMSVTFAVFEHIMDMDGVLSYLYRKSAPGALGFHFIDLADHRFYRGDGDFSKFHFLADDDRSAHVNKLRKSQQIAAFEKAGFIIEDAKSMHGDIPKDVRKNMLPEYKAMSKDDQTAFNVRLIIRKPK